jgi:hypothetical protein
MKMDFSDPQIQSRVRTKVAEIAMALTFVKHLPDTVECVKCGHKTHQRTLEIIAIALLEAEDSL